jgi:choline kinase
MDVAGAIGMRAIILAGGVGRRLGALTRGKQKCLLSVAGETILARAMRMLFSAGITEITIVTGHCAERVRDEACRRFPRGRYSFVHNERYASTSTAYPVWLARFGVNEPLLLLDGDVVFEPAVLAKMLASKSDNIVAVSRPIELDDEQIKVVVDDLGRVTHLGKTLDRARVSHEAIGMAILSRKALTHLFPTLERRVITENRGRELYEAAFQELIAGKRLVLRALDLGDLRCLEIDTVDDLQRARRSFTRERHVVRALPP